MRSVLRGGVGVLLMIAAEIAAPSAPAQTFDPRLGDQPPLVRTVAPQKNTVPSEGQVRLEEMKVELALLADRDLFPHSLGVFAAGNALELCGFVPNEAVKQRALALARRSTFLTVRDVMKVHNSPSTPPPKRAESALKQEAAELLERNLGDPAKQITLNVRPNGLIAAAGPIDSLENKLAVSRLFREVSGCTGVVNELIVQRIVRDGQCVVRLTRDGSMIVPPSALGLQPETVAVSAAPTAHTVVPASLAIAATPPPSQANPPQPAPQPAKPVIPPPPPTNSLDGWESELHLPTASPSKATQATPTPAAPQVSQDDAKLPTGVPLAHQPAETNKQDILASQSKPSGVRDNPHPNFAETRTATESARTGRCAGGSEASEPMVNGPAFGSSRRWPPAYETQPAVAANGKAGAILFDDDTAPAAKPTADHGKVGVILFDEDPAPPPPKPALATTATSPPLVPADLERQVKSVCGRQAQAVWVETQSDGMLLVKVKVPSESVQDQLTRKIFAIPGMTSPKVRLIMDVGP